MYSRCSFLYNSIMGCSHFHTGSVLERARRGTRMKRDAIKRALKIARANKIALQPKRKRNAVPLLKYDDSHLKLPVDNVYPLITFKFPNFTLEEAIDLHREVLHPTMLNSPKAELKADIELDLATSKKTKFMQEFTNILLFPNYFDTKQARTVAALAKDEDKLKAALNAGATEAFDAKCVKLVKAKKMTFEDFDHVIAHAQILPELVAIKNHLKKKFPSPKLGTAGHNLEELVEKYVKGLEYSSKVDQVKQEFGSVVVRFGTLDMPTSSLIANFKALLEDVEAQKPKIKHTNLISLVKIICPPNDEIFKINHKLYIPQKETIEEQEESVEGVF